MDFEKIKPLTFEEKCEAVANMTSGFCQASTGLWLPVDNAPPFSFLGTCATNTPPMKPCTLDGIKATLKKFMAAGENPTTTPQPVELPEEPDPPKYVKYDPTYKINDDEPLPDQDIEPPYLQIGDGPKMKVIDWDLTVPLLPRGMDAELFKISAAALCGKMQIPMVFAKKEYGPSPLSGIAGAMLTNQILHDAHKTFAETFQARSSEDMRRYRLKLYGEAIATMLPDDITQGRDRLGQLLAIAQGCFEKSIESLAIYHGLPRRPRCAAS